MMDFIKDLHEARMTRNESNTRRLTYTDCCERMYLILLVLELLRNFPGMRGKVQEYARRSSGYESYKHFRMHGTDLYNFVYFVSGDEDAMNKLKDPGAAKKLRAQTTLPLMMVNRYITQLANGSVPTKPSELFIKLESVLGITNPDYKRARRVLLNFVKVSTNDKKTAVTKLLFAARAKLRNSDIIDELESLASARDLESMLVKDTEPTVSTPDTYTDIKYNELIWYRQIVGPENLFRAIKAVEIAQKGKTVSPLLMNSYLPAMELLNDIVKAGPAYIGLLKAIHKKAKNSQ